MPIFGKELLYILENLIPLGQSKASPSSSPRFWHPVLATGLSTSLHALRHADFHPPPPSPCLESLKLKPEFLKYSFSFLQSYKVRMPKRGELFTEMLKLCPRMGCKPTGRLLFFPMKMFNLEKSLFSHRIDTDGENRLFKGSLEVLLKLKKLEQINPPDNFC